MATELYMDNYAKQFQAEPPELVSAVDCHASLRAIRDKVVTTADFHDGSHIYAARPPKGWKWSGRSLINHGALGTGVMIALGTGPTDAGVGADLTKFLGSVSGANAEVKTCNVATGIGYEFDGETDIILAIGGADSCTVDIDIIVELEFYAVN